MSSWNISVLTVYGNLTLIDTSINVVANQGRIIGRSCGIAASSGNVTMKGGQITGVNSSFGRGVFVGQTDYISPRGSFTMEGGAITNNTISGLYSKGGGVYVENGTFTMTSGTISGNTANTGGGGVSLGQRGWMQVGGTANISDKNKLGLEYKALHLEFMPKLRSWHR